MHTGGGLFLRPRDMAKTGYLFLNGGRWQGKQIVSEQWVRESTKQPAPSRLWLPMVAVYHPVARSRSGAYAVQGHGGQFIFVIPVLEMVTVITSWNVGPRAEQPFEMLQKYILPAAEAANPAP